MMLVTGANDPRVPPSEAEQMVRAVRANGHTAWHLIGQNEGHGFARKENLDYQFWVTTMFWQQNLLGGAPATARSVASVSNCPVTARRDAPSE